MRLSSVLLPSRSPVSRATTMGGCPRLIARALVGPGHGTNGGSLPRALRRDWESGLAAMQTGKMADAELALLRAVDSLRAAGAPTVAAGAASGAAVWRDLARSQSMQGKEHAALQSLTRALATVDQVDTSVTLLDLAERWCQPPGLASALDFRQAPPSGEGVPPKLELSILDNLVSHCAKLQGDTAENLRVRLLLLERAEHVRAQATLELDRTLEEKASTLYKGGCVDDAIVELRRSLEHSPETPVGGPGVLHVLRTAAVRRTLAGWLAERAAARERSNSTPVSAGEPSLNTQGGTIRADREEAVRLLKTALASLEEWWISGSAPSGHCTAVGVALGRGGASPEDLKAEVARLRFALLLQMVVWRASDGVEAQEEVERYALRLLELRQGAEASGAAGTTRDFTQERRAWQVGVFRQVAEALSRVGSAEAPAVWRETIALCRQREHEEVMKMGLAKPTVAMRLDHAGALLGLAASLHPPWKRHPLAAPSSPSKTNEGHENGTGSWFAQADEDVASCMSEALEPVQEALREGLEILSQQPHEKQRAEAVALGSLMLARCLRLPVATMCRGGLGPCFLDQYPARGVEYAKLMEQGLSLSLASVVGSDAVAATTHHVSSSQRREREAANDETSACEEEEETFGDQRQWSELGSTKQEAAILLGWDQVSWDAGDWIENSWPWEQMGPRERAAAQLLSFGRSSWNLCHEPLPLDEAEAPGQGSKTGSEWHSELEVGWLRNRLQKLDPLRSWESRGDGNSIISKGHRRAVELSLALAADELLLISHEMSQDALVEEEEEEEEEEEVVVVVEQVQHEKNDGASAGRDGEHTDDDDTGATAARRRWWERLLPACDRLLSLSLVVDGESGPRTAAALRVLASATEGCGMVEGASEAFAELARGDWKSPRARIIRREGKFELARLLSLTSPEKGQEILRAEFEELVQEVSEPLDRSLKEQHEQLKMLAVLEAQGKEREAIATAHRLAKAVDVSSMYI